MNDYIENFENKLKDSITFFDKKLQKISVGRAHPSLVSDYQIDYYETMTPLDQICSISCPEPQQIIIKPYDISIIKNILSTLSKSKQNFTPIDEGDKIRISIPSLTEETRKTKVKEAKTLAEDAKVTIRNLRRDINNKIKKAKTNSELTEDDVKSIEKSVQDLTDKYINIVVNHMNEKEKLLMKV